MHSRMRTVCSSSRLLGGGGVCPGGGGGVCSGGGGFICPGAVSTQGVSAKVGSAQGGVCPIVVV